MKKKLLCLLLALILLLALAGCHTEPNPTAPPATEPSTEPGTLPPTTAPTEPELTAESLRARISEAMEGRNPTQMNVSMDIDLDIQMKMEGFRLTIDASMGLDMDTVFSEDPYAIYAEMAVNVESMDQAQVQKADVYYLVENGRLVCYTYDRVEKMWTFAEVGDAPEAGSSDEDDSDTVLPPLEMTLDEDTQKVNRREVYVLRCVLTRDHLAQFITPISPMTDTLITPLSSTATELPEDLRADTVIYVDTETLLPIQVRFDILGLEDYLNDLITDSSSTPATELSLLANVADKEDTDSPYRVSVNTFRVILDELSFDPAEIPAVPQEAYDYLEMVKHNPLQTDGSYILVHTGAAARITPPENWEVQYTDFYRMQLAHKEQSAMVVYIMYSDTTRQQLQQLILSDSVVPMQEQDIMDSYGYGDRIGKFDTLYAKTTYGLTMYYAWAPMSDGWLLISVRDESGADMYELLPPLVEAVENCDPLY